MYRVEHVGWWVVVVSNAGVLRAHMAELAALTEQADTLIEQVLSIARETDTSDRDAAAVLLEAAEAVGRCEQARYGQLIQLLAQADRVKATRGGLAPWASTRLNVSNGKARGIAEAARRIGDIPQLADALSSGNVGADTVHALSRAAKTLKHSDGDTTTALTEVLTVSLNDGVSSATKRVRELEHTLDPGNAQQVLTQQRAKSYARISQAESGMCRIEALLDPVRAVTLRTALDAEVSHTLRTRQLDQTETVPADVHSTEQLNAQALVRLAQVYLAADAKTRGAGFTMPVGFITPIDADGLAESVYGDLVPVTVLPAPGEAGTLMVECDRQGQPIRMNGANIDSDPTARLASPVQRVALGIRDRRCTYPGCSRPPTWSPHAHHVVPFSKGGATVMRNLALLCSEHHTLTHRER
jgi:HNH endonuclease